MKTGDTLWWCDMQGQRGPFPATVIVPGDRPLLVVHGTDDSFRIESTNWLLEDGSSHGWLESPADGSVPSDLFL